MDRRDEDSRYWPVAPGVADHGRHAACLYVGVRVHPGRTGLITTRHCSLVGRLWRAGRGHPRNGGRFLQVARAHDLGQRLGLVAIMTGGP